MLLLGKLFWFKNLVCIQVMQKMGMKHSPADIEEMIKEAGSDCGKVDREQFLKMVSTG